jgi:tRNA threonylcarbamoyladenosine modification (KEOPS) complex  Pcc1 subunit
MLKAEILLDYDNSIIAQAIAKAVSPDNTKTPKGLSVKTVSNGGKVATTIDAQRKFATFIATIDDLLFCVSIAEKTIQAARELE